MQSAATFVQIILGKSPFMMRKCLSYYIATFLQQVEWFLNRTYIAHVNDEQSSLGHEPADPIISFKASLLDEWSL